LVVAQFWLAMSKDEQLRPFKARDEDPLKRFKVDREDWANRRYHDAYQVAAADMIAPTRNPPDGPSCLPTTRNMRAWRCCGPFVRRSSAELCWELHCSRVHSVQQGVRNDC
jgi:hypothetical protein